MQFDNLVTTPNSNYVNVGFSAPQVYSNQPQTQPFVPYQQPVVPQQMVTPQMPMYYYPQNNNAGIMTNLHNIAAAYNQTSFGSLVDVVKQDNTQNVSMDTSRMMYTPDPSLKTSAGLAFNMLTSSEEPKPIENEEPTINPMFNGLVNGSGYIPQQKFALQPISEDMDRSMLPKPDLITNAIDEVNAHLIKNNNRNDLSNRKVNNWITRMLDQKGEDYFSSGRASVDEISRNAEKILDDMISGRVDYNKQGQQIIQPVIIETLINYCSNKLAINKAIQYSLGYVYNDYTNRQLYAADQNRMASLSVIDDSLSRNITQAIAIVNQDIAIYEILYNKLMYVNATKNASALFSLTNDLNNYKKQAKKRY